MLIGAAKGVFLLEGGASTLAPVGTADITGGIHDITELNDGSVLVRAFSGWFLLESGDNTFAPIGTADLGSGRFVITDLKGGRLLVGSEEGLFELVHDDFSSAFVDFTNVFRSAPIDQAITIEIEVSSPCARSIAFWNPSLWVTEVDTMSEKRATAKKISAAYNNLIFSHSFSATGPHEYQLSLEIGGAEVGESKKVFAGGVGDIAKYYSVYFLAALPALHFLCVAGLLVGARRSATCFRIVQDPFWSKVGLYLNFLVRHWRPLQLWLLDRYFVEARSRLDETPRECYEPLPIIADDETVRDNEKVPLADAGLLDVLAQHRHIWLHGRAGMGKTALVSNLERAHFAPSETGSAVSAFSAYRRWGQVLVFVSARHYEREPTGDEPETWVVRVVSRRLAHFGVGFSDDGIVRALLQRGTLGVVIDGVNEVGKEDEVVAFALVSPDTAVLATLQTEAKEPFTIWRLPADVHEYVGKLLRAHMGDIEGERLEYHLHDRHPELLKELRSGYDVRLVIDLALLQPGAPSLPSTREGLYKAILDAIGPEYPRDELGARAWNMWREERRELPHDDAIMERIIRPLDQENGKVIRRLSGESFEFRHDQMRAYLAAQWLVEQAANAEAMLLHVRADSVWRVAARDQEEIWPFVAALLPTELLSPIWNFALDAPERVRLQHALQHEAKSRNVPLQRSS